LNPKIAASIVAFGLPIGLLGSHLWYCATEDRGALLEFGGIASFGGIFSTLTVLCAWVVIAERDFREKLPRWLDVAFVAFAVTAALSRLGCFMAHDHPGPLTNSLLGVKFPSGTRYDLGLLECLFWCIVCTLNLASHRRRMSMQNGMLCSGVAIAYGLFRLWADANQEHPDVSASLLNPKLPAILLIALGFGFVFRSKISNLDETRAMPGG
jgi:prolipoprotein diacylglyceryltransferase